MDLVKLVVEPNGVLDDQSQAYLVGLMEHITPSQDWGATGGVPPGVTVALKNGFAVIDGWQINTEGWVHGDDRNYLIGVLTNGNVSEDYGIDTVRHLVDRLAGHGELRAAGTRHAGACSGLRGPGRYRRASGPPPSR